MLLRKNDHILFYGDSITDAGRFDPATGNNGLGSGYVAILAERLAAEHADMSLRVTNTGISGNRVYDLETRLETDLLEHEPAVVSVLIGINDTWRRYDSDTVSAIDAFHAAYNRILYRVTDALNARLVILEPFLLPVPEDRRAWREDLDPRIAAVRDVARAHKACYVPLDGIFAAASCEKPCEHWLPDGVHPTPAGHALIAEHWLEAVRKG
jgi:lysophospholipase L1-like esterase